MSTLLVPVVKIESIVKHSNADTLSIAKFEGFGWQTIIKNDQYKIGDLAIFVPPDAILPQWIINTEQITYLKSKVGRVGAVKLRGEVSQGLLLPLSIYEHNPFLEIQYAGRKLDLGTNVADALRITKWEPPEPPFQKGQLRTSRKINPTFPKYTDIEHWDNFVEVLEVGEPVVITEKIHGTNFRAGWAKKQQMSLWDRIKNIFSKYDTWYFTCGSRNVEMGMNYAHPTWYDKRINRNAFTKNIYQQVADTIRQRLPKGFIIYGEIYGDKIQDLTYGLKGGIIDFVVFDVMYDNVYLDYEPAKVFLQRYFATTNLVPVLYIGEYHLDTVKLHTDGRSILAKTKHNTNQIREGCVIRPVVERTSPLLGRVILKSVSTAYHERQNGTEFK